MVRAPGPEPCGCRLSGSQRSSGSAGEGHGGAALARESAGSFLAPDVLLLALGAPAAVLVELQPERAHERVAPIPGSAELLVVHEGEVGGPRRPRRGEGRL